MPKSVDAIIDDILRREGGDTFTNRPSDQGGPTKFGITADTLSRFRGGPVTADNVKVLTEAEARDIYYAHYVAPWAWVLHEPLRLLLVDWGVTTSHGRVVRLLQVALAELGYDYRPGFVDGVPGPKTRAAVERAHFDGKADALYKLVVAARVRFYVKLALDEPARECMKANPKTQLHNVAGWVNRALEFL